MAKLPNDHHDLHPSPQKRVIIDDFESELNEGTDFDKSSQFFSHNVSLFSDNQSILKIKV